MQTVRKCHFRGASIHEEFETGIVGKYDVIVCGGGPAGISAALSAARAGAKTMLIETHGCLGGIWTAGALCWIIDHENKGGVMREILRRLNEMDPNASNPNRSESSYDVESMKFLLESMALEAGVRIRLHTRVVAAVVNEKNRLTEIVTESKSGREAWAADMFVDATGDGDVAAYAGCRFQVGHPERGESQPMSLMALLTGIDPQAVRDFHSRNTSAERQGSKSNLLKLLVKIGHAPSYSAPTLFCVHDNLFALMANHEYGVSAMDADDITNATIQARAEIYSMVGALRNSGGAWKNVALVATAEQIGIREGRRILGKYTVSSEDLEIGKKHDDAICSATFCVDIHSTNPDRGKGYDNENRTVQPYQIPLRAAQPLDVDGLLLAGRCISGDFFAHASYRVTGNAVEMGEGVGRYAAEMAREHSAGILFKKEKLQEMAS